MLGNTLFVLWLCPKTLRETKIEEGWNSLLGGRYFKTTKHLDYELDIISHVLLDFS